MMDRTNFPVILSIWLVVLANVGLIGAERWSRQIASSDWIPLADPRNQQQHNQNVAPSLNPQVHQPLIPGSLPPELRQEYQQQLLQLQKTQESIQRLLLLQQQLKAQQQLLQGQAFLPSGTTENEENKQALHQSAIANPQTHPDLSPEVLLSPQLSNQPNPPLYNSQNFHEPQSGGAIRQEQYEDYNDHQISDYKNGEREQEEGREKNRYVPEAPSGPGNDGESSDDGEEEIQLVYVPAETLSQRGQTKSQQADRERKQFGNQDTRHHQHRPHGSQHPSAASVGRQRDNVPTKDSPKDDAYTREFLQQLQREHEGTDRLLQEARDKEFERLREERKEIQRRAKLQQAAIERQQEIQRQREAEKTRKELAKLEEAAKQRELERLRGSRERQRLEDIERKEQVARANEEKRIQEEARRAEIEHLAALERQKNAEIEASIAAQKSLEMEAERSQLAHRNREMSKIRHGDGETSPQAEPLVRNQQTHQQLAQSGKYNRHGRIRNKPRQRQHSHNVEQPEKSPEETTTMAPPSPNQPPLAVYMSNLVGDTRNVKVTDVLKTLKGAKSIDVLDTVGQNAPHVFVGPSNLQVPGTYAKFDLPYLSAIDNNRVERRVDKLPFFVAPLSFNPPTGYSKIPFPSPHIGSVVINNLDSNISIDGPDDKPEPVKKPNLNPLIEPNSFRDDSSQVASYSTTYDSSTPATRVSSRHEEPSSTPVYQSSPSYSNIETSGPGTSYRFRQTFDMQTPSRAGPQEQSTLTYHQQLPVHPTYQEESGIPVAQNVASRYNDDSPRSTTLHHGQPNVVTSFAYQESTPQVPSSTPIYENAYSNVRDDSSNGPGQPQRAISEDDTSQHREVMHRHHLTDQRKSQRGQEYSHAESGSIGYEDSPTGPTQYNLPAELPPIHPQLPGLVNSLLEENGQAGFASGAPSLPTTEAPTTTKAYTTTRQPGTTHRTRGRHRGRVVPTRPTTTTTTLSPPLRTKDTDRTRRPFGRTRSRYTTTTEDYRETYEPTKAKTTATTPRYNNLDNYRRSTTAKYKSRGSETNLHGTRNQVQGIQGQEAADSRYSSLESNTRRTEATEGESNEPVYAQYDYASATTSRENYPIQNTGSELNYSKNLNPPQANPSAFDGSRNQENPDSQRFQERYPTSDFAQSNIEDAPINGFNYQIRNEQATSTQLIPPVSRDYPYYQDKQEASENSQIPSTPTSKPFKSQINDYQHPELYEDSDRARPQSHFPINEAKTTGFGETGDGIYDYSRDNDNGFGSTGSFQKPTPIELVTEAEVPTTTTEATPLIIRQRVRARLGGRVRPDSPIQTKPRGSQDEYVRFSAINNNPTSERSTNRNRENQRTKPKVRQQSSGLQPQTEGNDYVRIQAPIRTYQKTIVTPPSTTPRTTTVQTPVSTPIDYEAPRDELEYGFIRTPNFAPVHPVEKRYHNSYKHPDNQVQLQSILPSDETAADSIASHVSRNRPKYQSPNRRPADRAVSSTTIASETARYTEKSRARVEEPKNNRIRVRGRKPGRRRTTTTTTTTTEYVVEDNNDLPIEENYPRPAVNLQDSGNDGADFYNEKFVALPLASGSLADSADQRDRENSFARQDFLLNFGSESDHEMANPESVQTHLASQSSRKYGESGKTHDASFHQEGSQDRDIYGSESQWSTKLTSASFQPSPIANRLTHDDRRPLTRNKSRYSKDEAAADVPDVITAPPSMPEESYVNVMVSSDILSGKSVTTVPETSSETSSTDEGMNYGMKMIVEGDKSSSESTTSASVPESTLATNSTGITGDQKKDNGEKSVRENQNVKRAGGRRRRVRVRVRPAASDDFVTAESQHFNSAVNNLFRDLYKHRGREEQSVKTTTTTESFLSNNYPIAETSEINMFQDLLKDTLKNVDDKSSTKSDDETPLNSEVTPITNDQSEIVSNRSKSFSDHTQEIPKSFETIENDPENFSDPPENVTEFHEFLSTIADRTDFLTTPEMTLTKEESRTEKIIDSSEENTKNDDSNDNEITTAELMTTTIIAPIKSYGDAIASNTDEYFSYANENYENGVYGNGKIGRDDDMLEKNKEHETSNEDAKTSKENNDDNHHPKNHRSEWSEVRYPTNPDSYNRHFRSNLTASSTTTTRSSEFPGIVTKSDGDESVKTLSDYVKAIFDTMKNSDEEKIPTTDSSMDFTSDDDESVLSTDSTGINENSASTTTITSIFENPTDISATSEDASVNLISLSTENNAGNKMADESPMDLENSDGNETEFTEKSGETAETTRFAEETTEIPTEANFNDFGTSLPTNSAVSSHFDGAESAKIIEPKINDVATAPIDNSGITKNSTETKLGAILRTLTTTRVSHMTEICYRGKCVLTKPRKEINAR